MPFLSSWFLPLRPWRRPFNRGPRASNALRRPRQSPRSLAPCCLLCTSRGGVWMWHALRVDRHFGLLEEPSWRVGWLGEDGVVVGWLVRSAG
ncbi:uncharacterized protein BKA78DRAFT_41636 [Phyllosticta capitalensis]|uniref:uncharacterized protein n=1 Tax=Phyllosticta capitalensis TaxID=121624 RepID=UPI00312EB79F